MSSLESGTSESTSCTWGNSIRATIDNLFPLRLPLDPFTSAFPHVFQKIRQVLTRRLARSLQVFLLRHVYTSS